MQLSLTKEINHVDGGKHMHVWFIKIVSTRCTARIYGQGGSPKRMQVSTHASMQVSKQTSMQVSKQTSMQVSTQARMHTQRLVGAQRVMSVLAHVL